MTQRSLKETQQLYTFIEDRIYLEKPEIPGLPESGGQYELLLASVDRGDLNDGSAKIQHTYGDHSIHLEKVVESVAEATKYARSGMPTTLGQHKQSN